MAQVVLIEHRQACLDVSPHHVLFSPDSHENLLINPPVFLRYRPGFRGYVGGPVKHTVLPFRAGKTEDD